MFDIYLRQFAEAQSTRMVDDLKLQMEVAVQAQSITVEEYSRLLLVSDLAYRANLWMEMAYEMAEKQHYTTKP